MGQCKFRFFKDILAQNPEVIEYDCDYIRSNLESIKQGFLGPKYENLRLNWKKILYDRYFTDIEEPLSKCTCPGAKK